MLYCGKINDMLSQADLKAAYVTESQLLTEEQFERAIKKAKKTQLSLEHILMEEAFITPKQFLKLLSEHFGVPSTELTVNEVDTKALKLISEDFADSYSVVPFKMEKGIVHVAMLDPSNQDLVQAIEAEVGMPVKIFVTTEDLLKRAFVLYRDPAEFIKKLGSLIEAEPGTVDAEMQAPEIVNTLLNEAIIMSASDIHIEPYETEALIRFRVDGQLRSVVSIPVSFLDSITARIKILGRMKVYEKRLPQDGRFSHAVAGEEIDVRISIIPSMWGEKVVLRILPKEHDLLDLTSIGLLKQDVDVLSKYLGLPNGMILVCGPTGSGKTTTLYASLQKIGSERIDVVNITTVEDPIEYTIPRVTQMQVNPAINLTFANGLRSLLRQDPDIIMVGEIRDADTADIAVKAALVGRMVMSSLHTNNSVGAIIRLLDIGVEPYLIFSTLRLVVSQRLVRKLCVHCRETYNITKEEVEQIDSIQPLEICMYNLKRYGIIDEKRTADSLVFYRSRGCERCDNTGFLGRTGVFELLEMDEESARLKGSKLDANILQEQAIRSGFKTMFVDGIAKVILGETDFKEVIKVTI